MKSISSENAMVLGVIFMLCAAFVLSANGALVHFGGEQGFKSTQLLIFRSIIEAPLGLFFILFSFSRRKSSSYINPKASGFGSKLGQTKTSSPSSPSSPRSSTSVSADGGHNSHRSERDHHSVVNLLCCLLVFKFHSFHNELVLIPRKSWFIILLRGFVGAISTALYINAMTILPLGDAMTVCSLCPILTTFMAYFVLNEAITTRHFCALLVSLFGVVMIVQPTFLFGTDADVVQSALPEGADSVNNVNSEDAMNQMHRMLFEANEVVIVSDGIEGEGRNLLFGYVSALLGALIAGMSFIVLRMAKDVKTQLLVLSHSVFCFVESSLLYTIFLSDDGPFALMVLFYDIREKIGHGDGVMLAVLFGIGACGYVGQMLLSKSAQALPAGVSSLLKSSEIVWSYFWQITLFNTIPSVFTIIGAVTIILSIVAVSYEKIKNFGKDTQAMEDEKKETSEYSKV